MVKREEVLNELSETLKAASIIILSAALLGSAFTDPTHAMENLYEG